jgi:c-di-GMP-binding flagellar brake protein YcgR
VGAAPERAGPHATNNDGPGRPALADGTNHARMNLSEPQQVTLPVQVAGILRRLLDAHALVHVSLPGETEYWLSAVIEVHPAQGYLLLDELTPRDGNAALQRARRVIVSAQIQGVDISFSANLIDAGQNDGLAFYRVALPESVRYWQRRASYRARVSAALVIPVTLAQSEGPVLNGELYDISAGGLGTRHRDPKGLAPLLGEVWEACRIRLPDAQEVKCGIEIRYIGQDERNGQLRLGGRFVDITRPQLKLIESFVACLEREHLRKMRRTRRG